VAFSEVTFCRLGPWIVTVIYHEVSMDIKVVVAMHKAYDVPADPLYFPLQVGAAGRDPIAADGSIPGDNTGENISEKNPFYCELTGLYWAWKNLQADAIGLVHYRRHFTLKDRVWCKAYGWQKSVLTLEETERLMETADILVPVKRRYFIETLYTHYSHTHDGRHLDIARQILGERCPAYLPLLDRVYNRTWGYMFNMCIMKRPYLDAYCGWLFPVLEEMEARVQQEPAQDMSVFDQRFYGRVSEILFNVWLLAVTEPEQVGKTEDVGQTEGRTAGQLPPPKVKEVKALYTEPVNWWVKGTAFLKAKFFGKKYSGSF
jgi:hypothetical protein